MTESQEDKKFARVIQKFEPRSKLLRAWKLEGGVSAQVTALEVEQPGGQTKKMIVRRHGAVDLKHNSRIAADEFRLLQLLQSVGLAAPKPYYLDQSGEIFSTPYLVIEYIEGTPEFALSHIPDLIFQLAVKKVAGHVILSAAKNLQSAWSSGWLLEMLRCAQNDRPEALFHGFAMHLSRIHQIECSQLDVSFLPLEENIYTQKLRDRPAKLDDSLDEGRIRDALESVWPLPQHNPSVLLHGDFWPGNILWKDGQLAAILDWEDAQVGDPLADVANSRLEILWAFGIEAMQRFTHQYQSMTTIDFTNLPYWDLCAALRPIAKIAGWGLDDITEKTMRERHRWFVTQAFNTLSAQ